MTNAEFRKRYKEIIAFLKENQCQINQSGEIHFSSAEKFKAYTDWASIKIQPLSLYVELSYVNEDGVKYLFLL